MAGLADQWQQLWGQQLWRQQLLLVLLKPPAQQPHGGLGGQLIAEHHQQFRIDGHAAGFDRRQPGLQIKGGLAPQPLQPAPAFRTVEGGKLAGIHGRGAAKTGSSEAGGSEARRSADRRSAYKRSKARGSAQRRREARSSADAPAKPTPTGPAPGTTALSLTAYGQ